jgi:LysW-gamma-L-lysine carboxypeptidase
MNADYPGWLLERMLAIPSPSGGEAELAGFVAGQMRSLGLRATVDAAGNAVGEIGEAERPRLLLLGHLDTVAPALPVRREGAAIRGRGAVDAKGPLAALLCAAASARVPGRVVVVGAVEEETPGSAGSRFLVATQPPPDAVVIGEPTGCFGVGMGYKGRAGVVYEVRRPACHSSSPDEKAVETAVRFWLDIRNRCQEPVAGPRFEAPTAALTRLEGDAEHATAWIDCRVPPAFDQDGFERFLAAVSRGGTVRLDERTPAIRRDRRDPVVRALSAAIRRQDGTPRLTLKTGTSDMNVVGQAWQVPMAAYGPGDSSLDHTAGERLELADLHRSIAVLAEALPALAGAVAPADDDGEAAVVTERLRALGYLE